MYVIIGKSQKIVYNVRTTMSHQELRPDGAFSYYQIHFDNKIRQLKGENAMRKRILSMLCVTALTASMLLGGCGSGSSTAGDTSSQGGTVSQGETSDYSNTVVTYAQIATWNTLFPWSKANYYSIGPIEKIFDCLANQELDGTFTPRAAASWEFAEDGMSVTVHLQENSLWHDGEKVTSADWLWTFETIADPSLTGATSKSGINILRGVDASGNRDESEAFGVEAPDDYTLIFYLDNPSSETAFFSSAYAWSVMPKHLLENIAPADLMSDSFWTNPVGSGPCTFISEVSGQEITMGSFTDYYLGAPQFGKLIYRVVASSNLTTSMMAGEIDACYPNITPDEAKDLEGVDSITVTKNTDVTALMFVSINNEKYDKKVRQAINYAIDKQLIVDQLLLGEGYVATSMAVPGSVNDVSGITYEGRDVEKAKELLKEAGFKEGTTITCAIPTGIRERIASIMQQNLAEAGITLNVMTVDAATMFSGIKDGTYDMGIVTVNMSANPSQLKTTLYDPEVTTFGHVQDSTTYDMMAEIEGIQDNAERQTALKKLYAHMDEEQEYILLYHEYIFNITSPRITGPSIVGYDKVWTWHVNK